MCERRESGLINPNGLGNGGLFGVGLFIYNVYLVSGPLNKEEVADSDLNLDLITAVDVYRVLRFLESA